MNFPLFDEVAFLNKIPIRISSYAVRERSFMFSFHEEFQICYVMSGSVVHTIGDKEFSHDSGSCAVFSPYMLHKNDSTGSQETPLLIYIAFRNNIFEKEGIDFFPYGGECSHFEGFKIPHFYNFGNKRSNSDALVREMIKEFDKGREMSVKKLTLLIADFFRLICTERISAFPSKSFIKQTNAVNQAVLYIKQNYQNKITIDTLSKLAGMSRRKFTDSFKSITGVSVANFLVSVRIKQAIRLMLSTDMLHDEVAARTGLNNHTYLSYVFSKYVGKTPLQYVNEIRLASMKESEIPFKQRHAWLRDV
ncbi:MAG: helix-turn-helix transcriptional regulator [Oscillospiraceae bacterium]|nr:helix-turn-helix transcriptional regulator [Oscillospiraceae bacterium]MBQ4527240.1 helix-turn-helix transcriptional regulator [Clostridia bacterium]